MKYRNGFVSNSSTSSFFIRVKVGLADTMIRSLDYKIYDIIDLTANDIQERFENLCIDSDKEEIIKLYNEANKNCINKKSDYKYYILRTDDSNILCFFDALFKLIDKELILLIDCTYD